MSINVVKLGIFAFLIPIASFADRYAIYDDEEYYSSGGGGSGEFFGFIIVFFGSIAALSYLFSSYAEWRKRKEANEKPIQINDATDWVLTIVGYLIVSFFICIPLFLIMKWSGGSDFAREYGLFIYIISFSALTYFRRT